MATSVGVGSPRLYIVRMPTTIEHLKSICESLDIKLTPHEKRERAFVAWFKTDSYVDDDGEKSLFVVLELNEQGTFFEIYAPSLYNLKASRFKGHALAVLAEIAFRTRTLQCEYDNSDGEVRFTVDHWIMDTQLSAQQVDRLLTCILHCTEQYHPVIVKAKDEGKIDFDCAWTPPSAAAPSEETLSPELAELVRRAGGAEGLARLLAERQG
jgi:hypothetical protein